MSSGYDVWFADDAGEFLARAGAHLAQDPVTGTVVTTIAHRLRATGRGGLAHCWFAVVTGPEGAIAGIAMRTAPFAPYPVYLLSMPDGAVDALAAAVLARGEDVGGATGLRPAADRFAAVVATATGRGVVNGLHHRLFELGTLVAPRPVPGRLRPVRADEAELALAWVKQFFLDADEQAGRAAGHDGEAAAFGIDDVRRKLAEEVLWFWEDAEGRVVSMVGANPPAYGVSRVGPVFTPKEERGRGWAGAAVAEVSRLLRARGDRVILFTDQANPTSNALYQALGYRPVVDTVRIDLVGQGHLEGQPGPSSHARR
ncbi:GNAT family N-acetyltransferase [Nocardioides nitrophenolicus]|uniref:GNAT family N-acetyltransferase n=1 Tax=Nocardioides nitrophenolicus TaxID=60489 RepID=UPI001959415B|nr:GNAT family N-acetyltransferase [Nocardioides nitrophenolicus]MBM7515881.1 GNAT superfamily N-acetyltransferase [Nocardioides nitrophenolicus]